MLRSFRAKTTSVFFWAIVVLLIIGLAGFGISTGGLGSASVARVGDREIDGDDFARAFDRELRAITQQVGRPVTVAEARQFGLDRFVLARLVNDAALDHETDRLGLSAGDEFVSRQIMATPAFQGVDGSFDREAYQFALDRQGLSVREFEEEVRREAARELLAAALEAPAALPPVAARTVLDFLGERRAFDWIALDAGALEEPVPEPDEEALRAFHAANPERYTVPETREITLARLSPEAVAATIEVDEERLRAAYEAARDRFETPERRFLERIGFATREEAEAARARLDAGEIDFDALAAERELAPAEIDQGLLAAADLAPEAREAVFAPDEPGIVGPVETPLGPSLYRVNGIVAASATSFEEARATLAEEIALAEAREEVARIGRELADLVAGGATVEEIAAETPAEIETVALNAASAGPLVGDPAFREAAEAAREGAETDPVGLADGSVAVLRVDAVVPPTLQPLDAVRAAVAADWRAEETAARLTEAAEAFAAEIAGGLALADLAGRLGVEVRSAGPLTRGETVPGAPDAVVAEIFAAEPGAAVAVPSDGGAVLARLDRVEPFDPDAAENAAILASVEAELDRGFRDDLLAFTTMALQAEAGVSVDQARLEGVLAQFP